MTTFITIFTLFMLYMAGCIADGQDVKPHLKHWLGSKLEHIASDLKPINYCRPELCQALRFPPIDVQKVRLRKISQAVIIKEDELFRAHMMMEMENRMGSNPYLQNTIIPENPIKKLVDNARKCCIESILDYVRHEITLEIDEDSHYPEIIIKGHLYVEKKDKYND